MLAWLDREGICTTEFDVQRRVAYWEYRGVFVCGFSLLWDADLLAACRAHLADILLQYVVCLREG